MTKAIGFTRLCWDCKGKKLALGGKLDKRKLWRCAACINGVKMKWNKGSPPSVGWWPVKNTLNAYQNAYRWWDGEGWSWPAFSFESAATAARWAAKKETRADAVFEWADRPADWPERSKT